MFDPFGPTADRHRMMRNVPHLLEPARDPSGEHWVVVCTGPSAVAGLERIGPLLDWRRPRVATCNGGLRLLQRMPDVYAGYERNGVDACLLEWKAAIASDVTEIWSTERARCGARIHWGQQGHDRCKVVMPERGVNAGTALVWAVAHLRNPDAIDVIGMDGRAAEKHCTDWEREQDAHASVVMQWVTRAFTESGTTFRFIGPSTHPESDQWVGERVEVGCWL